jgi:hypothetical protein
MRQSHITGAAERSAGRYSLFLAALNNIYLQEIQKPHPGAAHTRKLATAKSLAVANTYLGSELGHLSQAIEAQRLDGVESTQHDMGLTNLNTDAGAENAQAHFVDLENALRVQLERDIASMLRGLRNVALRAQISARARGITPHVALAQLREEGTTPTYNFQDRAGRRWPSEKMVRVFVRHALVQVWNETAMIEMSERGVTQAIIDHPDADFSERGQVIDLTENPGSDSLIWADVKDEVFHPNTHAWLRPLS